MLGKTELAILRAVFNSLPKEVHLRAISKSAGVSFERVVSLTKEMEEQRFVQSKTVGNMRLYGLNFSNPSVVKLCELFEVQKKEEFSKKDKKSALILDDLTQLLKERFKEALVSSFVFGSFARGTEKPGDIDLVVIIHPKTRKVEETLSEVKDMIYSRYGITLSPAPMTLEDFKKNLWKKQPAILNAVADRILLAGEEAFWGIYSSFVGGEYYGSKAIA